MAIETTPEEADLFDDIGKHAISLWEKSKGIEGLSTDPKMFSIMMFKRLVSNQQGYALLWKNGFSLEGDIILRAGIEAAICIAANEAMRDGFVELLHRDACFTIKGQVTMFRDDGDDERAREAEATLREMLSTRPEGFKPARLIWKELADAGGVPQLYVWHRGLSGMSSHVTGASVLRAIASPETGEIAVIERKMHLMMMAGATLQGSRRHAAMLEDQEDRKSTRLNSSHIQKSRMPSSA